MFSLYATESYGITDIEKADKTDIKSISIDRFFVAYRAKCYIIGSFTGRDTFILYTTPGSQNKKALLFFKSRAFLFCPAACEGNFRAFTQKKG